MGEMTIREIGQDEDFGHWFHDLLEREADGPGETGPADERFLVLSNEIGDWIGGLRFAFRGGVAQLIEIAVARSDRGQGHGHRLLAAFEDRAREEGAHLAAFWTDDLGPGGRLAGPGGPRVPGRPGHRGGPP